MSGFSSVTQTSVVYPSVSRSLMLVTEVTSGVACCPATHTQMALCDTASLPPVTGDDAWLSHVSHELVAG